MTAMQSLHDVFVHELRDLYSAEKMLVRALPKMARNASSPELADAFTNHLRQTQTHVTRIEEILSGLGEKTTGVKCKGMEGLIDEGKEVLDMDGEENALDAAIIGAAQRVEHYEIAAYGTAVAHAQAQGHAEAVRLLEATLEEEKEADQLLTSIAERGINQMSAAVADVEPEELDVRANSKRTRGNGRAAPSRAKRGRKNGAARPAGHRAATRR